MLSFSNFTNTEAAVILLLKYYGISTDVDKITGELKKHPDYPSLLSVSDVLISLKIENTAFQTDFEELADIPCPFIAYSDLDGGSLLVVTKVTDKYIVFSNQKSNGRRLNTEAFKKHYRGIVVVAGQAEKYAPAARDFSAFVSQIKIPAMILGTLLIVSLALSYHTNYLNGLNWRLAFLTLFKTAGLGTSILLLIQSVDHNNPLVQVVCRTTGENNCNALLSSKASKAFGIEWLSWSEVGFIYFSGTWLLVLFGSGSLFIIKALFIMNILSLPYTAYSIYYQARIAKQWCVLCCTVQGVLWLEFITLISYQNRFPPAAENWMEPASTLLICMLSPIMVWTFLRPVFLKAQQLKPLKEQFRKFKYNTGLFNQMLNTQHKYTQPGEEWSIVLGNRDACHVITMVSNPFCPPCSKTHRLLDELLDERADLQARIIFTPVSHDNSDKSRITKHLVALNDLPDKNQVKKALSDWYNQKQKNYERWAKAYPVPLNGVADSKMELQKVWCETAEVSFTPTMLVNGYQLPEIYQLPDLKYLLE